MSQCAIGVESVELFLSHDCCEGINDLLLQVLVLETVAWDVVGDVLEELGEVENLEQLIERNEAKRGKVIGLQRSWGRAIWQCAVSLNLDVGQGLRRVLDVRKAVG